MLNSKEILLAYILDQEKIYSSKISSATSYGNLTYDIVIASCILDDLTALKRSLEADLTDNLAVFKNFFIEYMQQQDNPLHSFFLEIALKLPDVKTVQDVCRIVLPATTKLIQPDFAVTRNPVAHNSTRHSTMATMHLTKSADYSEILEESASLACLANYVYVDNLLFDLREISEYAFKQHQEFYALIQKHERLTNAIYNHNNALEQLKTYLDNDTIYLDAPITRINKLINELSAGASFGDASLAAHVAYTEFKVYLSSLPQSLQATLAAKFRIVFNHLDDGGCVVEGAALLRDKLRVQEDFLTTRPSICTKNNRRSYGKESLQTGTRPTTPILTIDEQRLAQFLATQFGSSLKDPRKLLVYLSYSIRNPFEPNIMLFLIKVLSTLPVKQQSTLLQQEKTWPTPHERRNLLHRAAVNQPKLVPMLLNIIAELPEADRTKILQQTDFATLNALTLAIYSFQTEIISPLLHANAQLPEKERGRIFKQLTYGRNALMLAARYQPQILPQLLNAISQMSLSVQQSIMDLTYVYWCDPACLKEYKKSFLTTAIAKLEDANPVEHLLKNCLHSMHVNASYKQAAILDAYQALKNSTNDPQAAIKSAIHDPQSALYKALNIKRYAGFFSKGKESTTLQKMKHAFIEETAIETQLIEQRAF